MSRAPAAAGVGPLPGGCALTSGRSSKAVRREAGERRLGAVRGAQLGDGDCGELEEPGHPGLRRLWLWLEVVE